MHRRSLDHFSLFCSILVIALLCQGLPAWGAQDGTDITVTGEVTVLYADDFANKRSELRHTVREDHSGRMFNVRGLEKAPKKVRDKLKTGSVITVRGKARGREIYLLDEGAGSGVETVMPAAAAVSGEQKTIVLLANFLDASLACSVNDVEDLMFTDISDNSVDDLYQETSLGNLSFAGDVVGPYTINYLSTGSCDYSAWGSALEAAARAEGINMSDYNRKIYVIPRSNPCGWAGLGTVGGNPSRSWIFRCGIPDVYAHELGHNLGMNHASSEVVTNDGTKISEYGDISDIMGYGGYPLRQINAPHQEEMGWRDSSRIETVTASGRYAIEPLELYYLEAGLPQILKIEPPTGDLYYLSYRQPIGFDANLKSMYLTGLAIHRYSGGKTLYLDTLVDGGSYVDTTNGISFTQVEHSIDAVIVDIQLDGSPPPECGDRVCNGNEDVCSCPGDCGTPPTEDCSDGLDNDCDGWVDGADDDCAQSCTDRDGDGYGNPGSASCLNGPATDCNDNARGINPGASDTNCNGVDENCSGAADEGYESRPTNCGVGVCAATGQMQCQRGAEVNTCTPGLRDEITDLTCDGLDGDCDGRIDEDYVSISTNCGQGVCAATGSSSCMDGLERDSCAPGTPTAELCNDDLDNDCDGLVDGSDMADCDTEPPMPPGGLYASTKRKHVNLTWIASTDNVGVSGYQVWRNGEAIADTTGTSYTDQSITAGMTYTYTVTAQDAAGNTSKQSNAVEVTLNGGSPGKGGGKGRNK